MGLGFLLVACASPKMTSAPTASQSVQKGSFADDLAYLRSHTNVVVLEGEGSARVAVTPEWQGRVMTSAVADSGRSFGFVHRAFIDGKARGTAFDNYGGEDRFWLGPEGTKYSLYFAPGAPLDFDHWQTPHAFNEGGWKIASASPAKVTLTAPLHLQNHAGTQFDVAVERTVAMLSRKEVEARLQVTIPSDVRWVAFETQNAISNSGKEAWARESGLPNVWILGMYAPSKDTTTIVPFEKNAAGPVVRDDYFGKVPPERLVQHDGWLAFTCDGELRSKIGLPPPRAKSALGSYSPSARLLTIVQYDKPQSGEYPSGVWKLDADPYAGDVVNAYNDGAVAPGKPSLGGFYELETLSPGAALAPGQSLRHVHRTFHFVAERASLDVIARAVLGVSLP